MKSMTFIIGIVLLLGAIPVVQAQETAELTPGADACQLAWSRGFDAARRHVIENPGYGMGVFLNQNEVAPTDMWSAYRSVSWLNKCYLEAVCAGVNRQGKVELFDAPLTRTNVLGGAIPDETSTCPAGITINDMLSTIAFTGGFQPEELAACDFSREEFVPEPISFHQQMYANCRSHARLQTAVFDRVLRNMIMEDVARKTAGYLSMQIMSFVDRLKSLQDQANQSINNFNAVIGNLCTLSNAD